MEKLKKRIDVALGKKPADLLIKNVNFVNVVTDEIYPTNIGISNGHIAYVGEAGPANKVIDGSGKWATPGFIDGHVHIESSMLIPREFARLALLHGTTSIIADPHEIANVLGVKGVNFMIENSNSLPLNVYIMVPSCVPATHLETSGAVLEHEHIQEILDMPRVLGLAEMMNYPGVIFEDEKVLKKLLSAEIKDGHAPCLSGKQLQAYISSGIDSDHECTTLQEAEEKARLGMWIMIREGSSAKNMEALIPISKKSSRVLFATDDRHVSDLQKGYMNLVVAKAISLGLDPVHAIKLATVNPCTRFKIPGGVIAPSNQADIVLLSDLNRVKVDTVIAKGQVIVRNSKLLWQPSSTPVKIKNTMNLPKKIDLSVKAESNRIRVIGAKGHQLTTEHLIEEAKIVEDAVVPDLDKDILKIVVIERHKGTGNIGIGFVRGFGLQKGAIASTVAHDSHNLVVVGADDQSILKAIEEVKKKAGGLAAVGGKISTLALPIAGLMASKSAEYVSDKLKALHDHTEGIGCVLESPFTTLSFLALPVIPKLKLTDKGLVDVDKFQRVSLFV